jgi:hypothetical protein
LGCAQSASALRNPLWNNGSKVIFWHVAPHHVIDHQYFPFMLQGDSGDQRPNSFFGGVPCLDDCAGVVPFLQILQKPLPFELHPHNFCGPD